MPGPSVKLVRERLDAAGVVDHLRDLAQRATQLEIRTKDAAARTSAPSTESIETLAQRVVAGELAGLQLRFYADGVWWSDTILRAGDAFRLVRMQEGT